MRNIREEKSFFEGTVTLPAIAGALNRIYKTVDKDGLTQENSVTLKDELQTVADHFGISPKAAVLLAHITEQSGGNGSDEDDLSRFVGCSNIEFIGFREDLSAMEKRGVPPVENRLVNAAIRVVKGNARPMPVRAEWPRASEKKAIWWLTAMVPRRPRRGVRSRIARKAFFMKEN